MMESPRLPRRAWTPGEDTQLRAMALSGTRPGDIAAALNRSKAALEARAGKFEISLKLVTISPRAAATRLG
jgi:hypothetical protein